MSNRVLNCTTCNDNSSITFVADDTLLPLYGGISSFSIIGLNSVGSLDESFIYGSGFNAVVNTIQIQSDGKILVGGNFTEYDNTGANRIIRLNSDGSIDNTFVIGSGFSDEVVTIAIQSDGKILVGGGFLSYNGTGANGIIRLNTDGSIDGTFVDGSGFNGTVLTISIQSDGKILVGGVFTDYDGTGAKNIIRLNSNGSIDNTFVYGTGFNALVRIITIQPDGKILVGGYFSDYNGTPLNNIIRLNSNGSIDNTFVYGSGFNDVIYTISIQLDDKILVGGSFTSYNGTVSNYIIRLNSDGSIDDTFVYGTGFNVLVRIIQIQSNGKILVGGSFTNYNGTFSNYIIRLNSDGSIDNTFVIGNGFNAVVNTIQIQSDGTLLVGGGFATYKATYISKIIRLNTNGLYDSSLFYNVGFDGEVYIIDYQSDGKILVGGSFISYNGTFSNYIIRLNSDGSVDDTFVIGNGFDGPVNTIQIQSDGKILVGGNFTGYDGITLKSIIRLNSDGSIDDTFVIGDGFDGVVNTIVLQSDEKILVGGDFSNYDSITSKKIIRLNSNGSIDNTFVGAFGDSVYTIQIQSDGKILVGGNFTEYNGTGSNYIIRLNSDGSVDGTFIYGSGFDSNVNTITIQSDGKILIGGNFNSYPLNEGVFQLREGNCVLINSYGAVSKNQSERLITFGPFSSCIECTTPDDSAGIESIICVSCDDPESVTPTSVPHAIYINAQGRAIAQINTVEMGGFNGLNN